MACQLPEAISKIEEILSKNGEGIASAMLSGIQINMLNEAKSNLESAIKIRISKMQNNTSGSESDKKINKRIEQAIADIKKAYANDTQFIVPENITELNDNQVFVFGANAEGIHGKGSALQARKFGTLNGEAINTFSNDGKTWGIVTKESPNGNKVSFGELSKNIEKLINYANDDKYSDKEFLFTAIGTGLAGFKQEDILEVLQNVEYYDNIKFPAKWKKAYYQLMLDDANITDDGEIYDSEARLDENTNESDKGENINIYSGDINGYEKLSNFNAGPITLNGKLFKTLEHAFQYWKASVASSDENKEANQNKIMNSTTGLAAKQAGRSIKIDSKKWTEAESNRALSTIMKKYYRENKEAMNLLKTTGSKELTHIGKNGIKLDERFTKILTEIRDSYSGSEGSKISVHPSVSGKIILANSGIGKSYAKKMYKNIIDGDDLFRDSANFILKKYNQSEHQIDSVSDMRSVFELWGEYSDDKKRVAEAKKRREEVYKKYAELAEEHAKNGMTVLSSSAREPLISIADIAIIQNDAETIAKNRSSELRENKEEFSIEKAQDKIDSFKAKTSGLKTVNIYKDQYISEILKKGINNTSGSANKRPEFDKLPSYKEGQKTMTYAGIGSRQTPQNILNEMTNISNMLNEKGYKLQTGKTFYNKEEGANKAFSDGTKNKELFGPEKISIDSTEWKIAKELHPSWSNLTKNWSGKINDFAGTGGAKIMARNTNQVFGKNLDTPVDFVLFYAEEQKDSIRPKGGTGQAVEMARLKGIPTINMADKNWRQQLDEILSKNKEQENKPIETITKETISSEPDVKTLKSKAAGWKIHLSFNVNDESVSKLENILNSFDKDTIPSFKIGRNSGQDGKDATIYVGSADNRNLVVNKIEKEFSKYLTETGEDAKFDDKVHSKGIAYRFDIGSIDSYFHQYGHNGLPASSEDIKNTFGMNKEERTKVFIESAKKSEKILEKKYGTFFTGTKQTETTTKETKPSEPGVVDNNKYKTISKDDIEAAKDIMSNNKKECK